MNDPVMRRVGNGWLVFCPGCQDAHIVGDAWTFNGDTEKPTFSPSVLVQGGGGDWPRQHCHSFVRDGHWQFLADSIHPLAGQTVPMVPLPEHLRKGSDGTV